MKPYGMQAQMEKGHNYSDEDINYAKCPKNKTTKRNAMRYFKKVQRKFNAELCQEYSPEDEIMGVPFVDDIFSYYKEQY